MENINIILSIIVVLNFILIVLSCVVLKSLIQMQYALKQPIAKKLAWNKKVKPYSKEKKSNSGQSRSNNPRSGQSERTPRQRTHLAGGNQISHQSTPEQVDVPNPLPQRQPKQVVGENVQSTESVSEITENVIKHGRRSSSH